MDFSDLQTPEGSGNIDLSDIPEPEVVQDAVTSTDTEQGTAEHDTPNTPDSETVATPEVAAETEHQEESQIDLPESFRAIDPERDLETDRERELYGRLDAARKHMESDYVRKTQEVAEYRKVKEAFDPQVEALSKHFEVSQEETLNGLLEESIRVRYDAEFAEKYARNILEQLGATAPEGEPTGETPEPKLGEEAQTEADPKVAELEQRLAELQTQVETQQSSAQLEKAVESFTQEKESVTKSADYKSFNDAHWNMVDNNWAADREGALSYKEHAEQVKTLIKEAASQEASNYLNKKTQQPNVGAGGPGGLPAEETAGNDFSGDLNDLSKKALERFAS